MATCQSQYCLADELSDQPARLETEIMDAQPPPLCLISWLDGRFRRVTVTQRGLGNGKLSQFLAMSPAYIGCTKVPHCLLA